MIDQCKHCTYRGDLKACKAAECSQHENWYTQQLQAENDRLKKALNSVRHLINESYGIAGLHLNGDIAPWSEIQRGGQFEEWLIDFNDAEEYANKLEGKE